ncbi:TOMM precursor leader peptide-binding protein [Actibacterium ureilyticum]|uniref:TOMM precursor leader peptide-binding protein n=1 Tax=Actibacterium ureilyticum TaxID=1590614 RepID=UPI000BAAAE7C|nr:TOMM precursor leader peptide-binding protein [Actibacterium ureilyticum]
MHLHPALDVRQLSARVSSEFDDGTERGLEHQTRLMFRSAIDSFALRDNPQLADALRSGAIDSATPGGQALKDRGVLIDTPLTWSNDMVVQSLDLARRAFQNVLGDDPERVEAATLAQPVFSIIGQGRVADSVRRHACDIGAIAAAEDRGLETADAAMVCADTWDHAFFSDQNARLADSGLPYVFAYVDQTRAVAGPLCRGREAACYTCLFERRAAHGRAGRAIEDWLSAPAAPADPLAPSRAVPSAIVATTAAANAVALMIAHLSGMEHTAPLGMVREQELLSGTFEAGIVLKAPRCPVCGTRPDFAPGAPLRTGRLTWEAAERDYND